MSSSNPYLWELREAVGMFSAAPDKEQRHSALRATICPWAGKTPTWGHEHTHEHKHNHLSHIS